MLLCEGTVCYAALLHSLAINWTQNDGNAVESGESGKQTWLPATIAFQISRASATWVLVQSQTSAFTNCSAQGARDGWGITPKTLRFQQSLFITYLSGAVPLRSHSLEWMGRWPQTPHHPHSGHAWPAPWAEGWSCRTHRRSRASHGPSAEVEQLDREGRRRASRG